MWESLNFYFTEIHLRWHFNYFMRYYVYTVVYTASAGMTDPHSHLGLANPRTRAQYTADTHMHLYIVHLYAFYMRFMSDSAINI